MRYDMVRFERGQVWMVRFKNPDQVGHEQKKDRPWVVLSIGKFNKSANLVTMAPITTRDRIVTPAQVQFYNERGLSNVILCEHIRTFDYKSGAYIFDFMGNLSNDIMEKVDVALSIHLGIHYSPISIDNLYNSMSSVIKSIQYVQSNSTKTTLTEQEILEFSDTLKTLANSLSPDTAQALVATTVEEDTEPIEESHEEESHSVGKSNRVRWTQEKCEEFLYDDEHMTREEMMNKWSIETNSRYYSFKHYVKKIIDK